MNDDFSTSIPEEEQGEVLKLLSAAAEGVIPRETLVFETSRSSPLDSLITGSLLWKGREHDFTISVSSGKLAALLSWDTATRYELVPINAIVMDAINKGKADFLLDKWEDLSGKSNVSALLRRFDRQHFLDPKSDLTQSLRDRVASLGFEIVSRDELEKLRKRLSGEIRPVFRTSRNL